METSRVAEFVPERIAPERFARVEALVRDAAVRCRSDSSSRHQDLVRNATYLAAWCDDQHLPLRLDVVFHPDTIESFVGYLKGQLPERSLATMASVLRTMASELSTEGPSVNRHTHGARAPKPPYRPDEVAELFAWAERSRSKKRRHDLAALLVLGLGAGASGQEAALVKPEDVTVAPAGVAVVLRRRMAAGGWHERRVEVLVEYCEPLGGLRRVSGGYLLGGGRSRHSRVYDLCDGSRSGRWPVALDAARLRVTYLAAVANEANTVAELLERAGVRTLEVYDALLPYLARSQ